MKTETELKQTWCPFARGLAVIKQGDIPIAAAGVNMSEQSGVVMSLCIGLACSQCVDCGPVVETMPAIMSDGTKQKRPDGDGWRIAGARGEYWQRETGERHVYCGRNTGEALRQELSGMAQAILDTPFNQN